MHCLNNDEKEKWINDYVARETGQARTRVKDAEAVIELERKDINNTGIAGLTIRESENKFQEELIAIGDSRCNLGTPDDEEDGEDQDDEDSELCNLSKDDEPGWVLGTISKMVQQRMERFRQMQMKHYEFKQPGWGDAADYFPERDRKYGTTELKVPAVVKPQRNEVSAAPAPMTIGELMESLDIFPWISYMPQGTSRPGSRHMRLDSRKPHAHYCIASLPPGPELDSSPITQSKPVEPISF